MTEKRTRGAHHIGLTTPDLEATHRFFTAVLGFDDVGGMPDYPSKFISDGTIMVTLWQVTDMDNFVPFDRHRNAGLHHVAFTVPDDDALAALHQTLAAMDDVELECDPGPIGEGFPINHFLCRIPGGIRVEFATPMA